MSANILGQEIEDYTKKMGVYHRDVARFNAAVESFNKMPDHIKTPEAAANIQSQAPVAPNAAPPDATASQWKEYQSPQPGHADVARMTDSSMNQQMDHKPMGDTNTGILARMLRGRT